MLSIYQALKGALFAISLAILVFFLKVICPLDTGCLADPFLLILFYPLTLIEVFPGLTNIPINYEPLIILIFWAFVGFLLGFLYWVFRSSLGSSSDLDSEKETIED